jgi:hypothetical protein
VYLKHDFSKTGFCLHFKAEPTQLGPTDRAILCLRPSGMSKYSLSDYIHCRSEFYFILTSLHQFLQWNLHSKGLFVLLSKFSNCQQGLGLRGIAHVGFQFLTSVVMKTSYILGYNAVYSVGSQHTFRRNILLIFFCALFTIINTFITVIFFTSLTYTACSLSSVLACWSM